MKFSNNEKMLLDAINARDLVAFECLFENYYSALCFFANKILHDPDVARDLVQDVFVNIWEKYIRFNTFYSMRSYLYTCVQRKAINYLKMNTTRNRINLFTNVSEYTDTDYLVMQIEADVFNIIITAIETLPEECRKIFIMSYIEHMDIKEICELLGVAESTVKTQRSRAKKMLRDLLRHYKYGI